MQKTADPFPGIRDYLRARFGPDAGAATVEPLAIKAGGVKEGGYGVPYLVSWSSGSGQSRLVLETVRPGGFGHEDRADRAGILLRAYEDYGTLPKHVAAVDVGAFRKEGPAVSLGDCGELFLLTEFCEGEPYAADFDRIAAKGKLDEMDRSRARILADYLAEIHREPVVHPTWYRRRLRDLAGSGECIAGVADSYPVPLGFIDDRLLYEVEALVLRWRYRLRERADRLRAIHGDFHPWNIHFRSGTDFSALDRSRGAFGDPADDVASLAVNFLFFAVRTESAFAGPFAELFRLFWNRYLDQSGDQELADVIAPHFAFRALVLANPLWYPKESEDVRRKLFRFILGTLEAERFEPDRIPALFNRSRP
ncbi:MAG: aminoglycoside phosphotransferase family protein [Thermoanaerobaculia bacterium]